MRAFIVYLSQERKQSLKKEPLHVIELSDYFVITGLERRHI